MIRLISITTLLTLAACIFSMISTTAAANYSSGVYGSCQYGSCSISLASEPTVTVDVTPSGGSTRCSIQSNAVTAATESSTGYTVTINNSDTETTLDGPGVQTIASVSGTEDSPVTLTANTWGYRVDDVAGFGAGPTYSLASSSVPILTFAAAPSSASAGGIVRYTASADIEETPTLVWYSVCVDATTEAGEYTDSVLYTAVIN